MKLIAAIMGRLLICFMMKRWNILKALYIKLLQYHNTLTDTRLEWQERLITVDVPVYEKGLCVWTLEKSEHQMRLHYQMSSWCTLTEKGLQVTSGLHCLPLSSSYSETKPSATECVDCRLCCKTKRDGKSFFRASKWIILAVNTDIDFAVLFLSAAPL